MRLLIMTNTAKSKVTKDNGVYKIEGIPVTVDDSVMNNTHYDECQNKKGMRSFIGMPITLTHPENKDGYNVSALSPDGIDYYAGGKITDAYNKGGVWYFDSEIKEKKIRSNDDKMGDYFADRLDAGLPIGVSTGLLYESNDISGENAKGEKYSSKAINIQGDHLAMLHESEKPAGGDATVMRFNGEDVQAFNFEDIKPVGPQNELIENDNFIDKLANKLKGLFANDNQTGYNNTDLNTNHEAPIMDRTEMLEALGLATNSQVTDDELKTLLKTKLAANASEVLDEDKVTSIVEQAVNAAVKPLQDQLTANADKELNEVAEQVAALNKGLDAEDAKALGLTKAKAFLAANSAEYVADYAAPRGRASQINSAELLDSDMPE